MAENRLNARSAYTPTSSAAPGPIHDIPANSSAFHLAEDELQDHQGEAEQDQADPDPESQLDIRLESAGHRCLLF
jgi:hypothetical protein